MSSWYIIGIVRDGRFDALRKQRVNVNRYTVDLAYIGEYESPTAAMLEGVPAQNEEDAKRVALQTMHEPGAWSVLGVRLDD